MLGAAILWVGLGTVGAGDFLRPLGEKTFDQASFDAETFGEKKGLAREADGLRVVVKAGEPEAGWKTPQALRIGGDCTIVASLTIRKLPKPAQEDGTAIGLAVATQNIDQPEATLLRELEPDGKDVFRPIHGGNAGGGGQPMMVMNRRMMMFGGGMPAAKPPKPERHTFPAKGQGLRLEFRRRGQTLRYQVFDDLSDQPREIGQFAIGPGDLAGVKVFVSNRNGAEPVDVLIRDVTIHADRLSGLGTAVRTVFGTVVHGDPTGLEGNVLIVGGTPPAPPPVATPPGVNPPALPPQVFATPTTEAAVAPAAPIAAAPAPAPAGPTLVAPAPAAPAVAPAPAPAQPAKGVVAAVNPATPNPAPPPTPPAPKARLPLDEVESIGFERSSVATGRFLGQPNVDTTGPPGEPNKDAKDEKKGVGDDLSIPPPGTAPPPKAPPKVEAKPNGVRDLHLSLSGLREASIRQVMIQCPTDKGQAMWQLDTTGSQAWPLTLRRSGTESWADIFLEPPAGDCHDKQFMVTLTYADNQNANIQVKADIHTDPKLAFDAKAPAPPLDARVYLADDEQLFGKLEALTEEALSLTTPWGDRLDVPMTRVVGVYMGMPDHKESPESFAKRLKSRGSEDLLLARAKDGEVVAIAGVVEAAKEDSLRFVYQGKARSLPLKQVEGLILASRPAPKPPTEARPTFTLGGGIAVSGRWTKIEAATWQVESPWGQVMKLPAADIRSVRVRGGQMAYLSDLEPSKVEEVPYFGRRASYRKDVNLDGAPLKIDGQAIEKGLAVHSRSDLTYDLDGRYATFEALVGFDDSARQKGRVDCRVFADGKELYANPDLRADAAPVRLVLPVAGAEQLRLVVDYGRDEDTGDRVIWGNSRLYRRPPDVKPPTPPSKP